MGTTWLGADVLGSASTFTPSHHTFSEDSLMLKSRSAIILGRGLPTIEKPWKRLLTNDEQHFLTDNQLSLFVDPKNPGCEKIHFYPLPFPHTFGNSWDFEELVNHDSLRSIGPSLEFAAEETSLVFQPHLIEKQMRLGRAIIHEHSAVSGNTMAIRWETRELDRITLHFGLPHFGGSIEPIEGGVLLAIEEALFVALTICGAQSVTFDVERSPLRCWAEIALGLQSEITLGLSCGYDRDIVVADALAGAKRPESIKAAAETTWSEFFSRAVPFFSCSDERIEKLYYYQAYTTRANLYDIPYEPFTHPYTCPWKTGAVWQWSWNTPMNSVCERWLNDKQIGSGGILLEEANGGGLNIGTYLHGTRKITDMRGHDEAMQIVGAFRKRLPANFDLATYTTLPHTTPNGLLGAWEFCLNWGDPEFLRRALQAMMEAEWEFSRHELPNGLYTCSFIDEFDYSLRLKPFIAAFNKGDAEMMLKMDTPFIAVDYNCYLHALRERIMEAAASLPEFGIDFETLSAKNARLKEAINRYLWNPDDGFYYDADPRTMMRSGVKCIAAFAALYSGIADRAQADKLVAHLIDPNEFGTPYPCPSVSMDTPDVDPALITYGGDSLVTSGIWFTIEGLMRYGYRSLAAEYLCKTLTMLTLKGPSSSYSYHSLTGACNQPKHTLAAQCAIVTDLICKYVVGLVPRPGGTLEIAPLLIDNLDALTFGPYNYHGKWVTVRWARGLGYDLLIEETLQMR